MSRGALIQEALKPETTKRYCAVGLCWGDSRTPEPLVVDGRVVLYDTVAQCQQHLPQLGGDRIDYWTADGERVVFRPFESRGLNKAVILTEYDPYDVPGDWTVQMDDGSVRCIRSERRLNAWKHHVMYYHAFTHGPWIKRRADGSLYNESTDTVMDGLPDAFAVWDN